MENISKEYTRIRRESDIYTDTAADYSLPDYNGDIKKILYTSATVLPAAKFNDSDSVSSSGIVTYEVIYLNSENKIDHVSFNSDYDISAKLRGDSVVASDIETRVSAYSHRLSGPRRINMKATLVSELRITEGVNVSTDGCFEDGDVECVVRRHDVARAVFAHSAEREYAEAVVSFDDVIADEVEFIHTCASCAFDSVSAQVGGVGIKGAFHVSMLVRCADDAPILYKKKLPFDEFIEAPEVGENMSAIAYANVNSVSCEARAEEGAVTVTVSLIAEYCTRAYVNAPVYTLKDAYRKSVACENEYEDFSYSTHVGTEMKSCVVSHTLPISDLCDGELRNVLCMFAVPKITDVNVKDGYLSINAEMRIQGICASVAEDGSESYHNVKFSFQTEEKVNVNCQNAHNTVPECKIRVIDTSATLDEENMYVDVSYMLEAVSETVETVKRLVSCVADAQVCYPKRESEIIVYYPTSEDSLFSVAKKFHTSVSAIAADNMLTQSVMNSFDEVGSLGGIKRLVIR